MIFQFLALRIEKKNWISDCKYSLEKSNLSFVASAVGFVLSALEKHFF